METLEARLALMQAEAERLGWYLSTLSPDAWRQPSACQEWEVRDVVAHLVEVAQDYRCRIARGVQGEIGPHPEFAPPGRAFFRRAGHTPEPSRCRRRKSCDLRACRRRVARYRYRQ